MPLSSCQGGVFGRIDITRSMSVLVDSMKVTGVADNSVSPGMIRVQLCGFGPTLIPANVTISNNEVFGERNEAQPLSVSHRPGQAIRAKASRRA